MRNTRILLVSAVTLLAACGGEIANPTLDDVEPNLAKSARAQCAPSVLGPGATSGSVTEDDCLFFNGFTDQYEDLYLVPQGRLGTQDGNVMATFSLEAESFNWIFGLGGNVGREVFPTPVYAFRTGPAGVYTAPNGFSLNTFSIIGGEPIYKMWVGGRGPTELGDYTLSVSANPVTNTCVTGHRVYLQGDVSFSSTLADANSCEGVVEVGPNVGSPLSYQYWWVRMSAGETITLALDGVEEVTTAAAIIDFNSPNPMDWQVSLDLGDGEGDADRFVSFTAQRRTDIYVEVSALRGRTTGYTATVDGPNTR